MSTFRDRLPSLTPANVADVTGGFAAAIVVATQAMAFGIAVLGPVGTDLGTAARFGLLGLVTICLASGLARGTVGLISAPTGPVMVLMLAIATWLAAHGVSPASLPVALAIVIATAGITQMTMGASGAGRLVKLVPLPVVAGFMTGSGLLMIGSQFGSVIEPLLAGGSIGSAVIPLGTALATLLAMMVGRRIVPRIPAVLPGVIAGLGTFAALTAIAGPAPEHWFVGVLPAIDWSSPFSRWPPPDSLPWVALIVSGVALGAFAALDTLLTSLIADAETGERHDTRRELIGQGIGHLAAAVAGGMAGAGTTGATMTAVRSGGRRLAPVACALGVATAMLTARDLTAYLPLAVLSGVVIAVGSGIIERDIVRWFRRRRTRIDALTAILVATVTVVLDLMLAVGLGVVITVLQFVSIQAQAPVVARRRTAAETRSLRVRDEAEANLLDTHGDAIVCYELRGNIVFATADRLFEEMRPDVERGAHLVVSLKRVSLIDLTGLDLLFQIARRSRAHGGEVVFAHVHKRIGLGRKMHRALQRTGLASADFKVKTFKSADVAVERAEDVLLLTHGVPRRAVITDLSDTQIGLGLMPEQVAQLDALVQVMTVERGARIYRKGEHGDTLYVIRTGTVDIRLTVGKGSWSRLARIGPGMMFGEVSFTLPGPHTATAVATEACELYVLTRSDFLALREQSPGLCVALMERIAEVQSRRLRRANREILALNAF